MKPGWRAILAAATLLAGTQVAADELVLPTAPLRQYYAAAHANGAERSEALARALVVVSRGQPVAQRLELLQQASLVDPTWAAPHFERVVLELHQHDPASASLAFRDAMRCVLDDPVQQSAWLFHAERGAHSLLLATLVTLVALLLVRTLFFAQHLVEARPRQIYVTVVVLTCVMLWVLWQSPLAALLVATLFLTTFMSRKERRTLAALCIALALCEIPLPWLQTRAMILDPSSTSARLSAAQREGGDPRLEASLVRDVPHGREREFVLGLLARRRGDLDGAERYYSAAITADPNWGLPYVNLANVYFARGNMQRAAAGYRKAQTLTPESPYAHANLAQTYIRMLHFGEADQELHLATELDFAKIKEKRAAWLHAQVPVVDAVLGPQEILRLASDEARAKPRRAELLLQNWRGSGWDGLSPLKTAAVLLGLVGMLLSRWRLRAVVFECTSCARLVCTHCAPASRDDRARPCPYCDLNTARLDRPQVIADDAPMVERKRKRAAPRLADRMPRWIGTVFPGAADLACGAPTAALWTALVAWAALLAVGGLVDAASDRAAPWFTAANTQSLRLAVLVFFLAHLQGLLRLRRSWRRLGQSAIPEGR